MTTALPIEGGAYGGTLLDPGNPGIVKVPCDHSGPREYECNVFAAPTPSEPPRCLDGNALALLMEKCPTCKAELSYRDCRRCDGTGMVEDDDPINGPEDVRLPRVLWARRSADLHQLR